MKTMTKIVLVSTSILSVSALTACQSNPAPKDGSEGRPMMRGEHHKMSPEQRAEMKQRHEQHKAMREQMKNACDGKAVGQTVQIKAGEQTVDGTCNIVFKPDHKSMKELRDDRRGGDDRDRMMRHDGPRMKDMTEEQRAQIKQQFEQKRAERKAQWEAIQKSCVGQTDGKAIQVKLDDKTLDGKCFVKFTPNFKANNQMPPVPPMPPKGAPVPPKA